MNISDITVNTQNSIRIDCGKIIYIDPLDISESRHDADYIFITHYGSLVGNPSDGENFKTLVDEEIKVVIKL